MNTQIVVLSHGFVYVGHVSVEDSWVIIQDARNIRLWGTTRGLGELVDGPTRSTILDKVGTVRAPLHALVHLIDADAEAWKSVLG